ncbi:diaminopimelate epimerase [Rhizobium sp. ERR 1071]|uniref:diaminopimelate epimerase n=1 Tax=Rhizobium sp. ERR 1071 TaxID=2572677 RepID=UPI0011A2D27A|nr:diaminopimelate epimerase [Rhizobium sp. ERR1071]
MALNFEKMQANGDDFVIIDLRGRASDIDPSLVARMGDRNRGIGFNQLAAILDCDDADARIRFWNPDGSALDACGSATRGVASKLMREAGVSSVIVRTNRGLLPCKRESDELISVAMGKPLLGWRDLPLSGELDTLELPLAGSPSACSMGNPHCTYFVDDVSQVDVETIGRKIESHPMFPLKTNVHFVEVMGRDRIRLRIWERGGGIPLGSGSCSCGAVVNGIRRGLLDAVVQVECDGGVVTVQWDGSGSAFLSGPVTPVFKGSWFD